LIARHTFAPFTRLLPFSRNGRPDQRLAPPNGFPLGLPLFSSLIGRCLPTGHWALFFHPPPPSSPLPSAFSLLGGHGHGHEHDPESLRLPALPCLLPSPPPLPVVGCWCQENVFEGIDAPLRSLLLPLYLQCPPRYHPLVLVTRWLGKKGLVT
jgi:hypothetical protein